MTCTVWDCDRPRRFATGEGLCKHHYDRKKRTGTTDPPIRYPARPLVPLIRAAAKRLDVTREPTRRRNGTYSVPTAVPGGVATLGRMYADRFGVLPKSGERMLCRLTSGDTKYLHLDTADRLCILLGTTIYEVYGGYQEAG